MRQSVIRRSDIHVYNECVCYTEQQSEVRHVKKPRSPVARRKLCTGQRRRGDNMATNSTTMQSEAVRRWCAAGSVPTPAPLARNRGWSDYLEPHTSEGDHGEDRAMNSNQGSSTTSPALWGSKVVNEFMHATQRSVMKQQTHTMCVCVCGLGTA